MLVVLSIINGTATTRTLNSCLGYAEQNFLNGRLVVCTAGNFVDQTICKMARFAHMVIASSGIEAYLLYKCFKKIQVQNESAKDMLGKSTYIKRKQ